MVQFLVTSVVTSSLISAILVQLMTKNPINSHRGSNYLLIFIAALIGLVAFLHSSNNISFSIIAIFVCLLCMIHPLINTLLMYKKREKTKINMALQVVLVMLLFAVTISQFGGFNLDVVFMIHVFCWLLVLIMWLHIAAEVWLLSSQYASMKTSIKDHWLFNECSFENRISSVYVLEWASIVVSFIALLHSPESMVSWLVEDGQDISYKTMITVLFLLLFMLIKLLHYFNKIKVYSRKYFFIVSTLPLALIIAIGISAY